VDQLGRIEPGVDFPRPRLITSTDYSGVQNARSIRSVQKECRETQSKVVVLGLPCEHPLLPVPGFNRQGSVGHEAAKILGMVKDALPKCVYRPAHIVDVDTGDVLMEKKLKPDSRAASIRLYIFAVEEAVHLHQALDVSG
jgi:hypothetical protein